MDDPVKTDIRQAWHWVGPLLTKLIEADPDIEALPEDVYADCKNGLATLWTTDGGFIITQKNRDRLSGRAKLNVWFAGSVSEGQGNLMRYMPFCERLAAYNQCPVLEFGTSHEWMADKVCKEAGFRKAAILLRKDIKVID